MRTSLRDTLLFHLAFTICVLLILFVPWDGLTKGPRIGLAVLLYHIALPLVARWRGHYDWFEIWALALAASILQVIPDWILADHLNVLVFPDGFLPIGPVSGYMAGMWAITFFLIISLAREFDGRRGPVAAYLVAGLTGTIIFVGSEATLWTLDIWYAKNVKTYYHVAYYVVVPEILLSFAIYFADRVCAHKAWPWRVIAAPWVTMIYTGALMISWFFIEGTIVAG